MSWRWTYALEFSQNPRKIQRQQRKTSNKQRATHSPFQSHNSNDSKSIDAVPLNEPKLRQRCWRSSLHCVRLLYLISLCFTLLIDFSLRYLSALLLCTASASASAFFLHSPCFPFSAHTSFFFRFNIRVVFVTILFILLSSAKQLFCFACFSSDFRPRQQLLLVLISWAKWKHRLLSP